jgi:hypothetical protein
VNGGQGLTEYQVKAAFLYNFVKFVEWPVNSPQTGPLVICVLGKDPFDGELERATEGKTVNGRPLIVRRLNDPAAVRSCQVLFVSSSELGRMPEVMRKLAGLSVLTVSDIDGFSDLGGIITFLMDGQRVRFRINQGAAERASLRISSKLLQLGVGPDDKNKDRR